ncbi:hypothetical protein [Benzoatithermus flavus]|uniref:Lipoprotein n=1 Tax=Benzoatithermus flavus TaxID=3108223 RepID=A0ABU8XQ73_9PROT
MRGVAALGMGALALLAACAGGSARAPQPQAVAAVSPATPPQRPDWSRNLGQLLPGIRACLAGSGGRPVGVTKAWPIGQNLTGVRVLDQSGDRLDCVAVADGRKVLLTEKVRANSRLAGERNPLYTPATAQRPASGPCLERVPARDAAGTEVGWLTYETCRTPGEIGPSAGIGLPRSSRPPPQG